MLTFTDAARDMLLAYMNQDDDGGLALRVTQRPGSPLNPHFELTLVSESDRAETDLAVDGGGFTVLVAEDDKEALEGATVDFVQRVNESGFEVRPVNQKTALSESRVVTLMSICRGWRSRREVIVGAFLRSPNHERPCFVRQAVRFYS